MLRWRLDTVVGCKHNAAEALQETWLRLEAMVAPGPTAAPVHNPDAYLLRMAANIATDAYRRDRIIVTERFGISVAMVKKEWQAAMQHCKTCMADADAAQRSDVSGRRKY